MQKIIRVGVLSLAKVMAISATLMSLIVCIPWGLFAIVMGIVGGASGQEGAAGAAFDLEPAEAIELHAEAIGLTVGAVLAIT